MFVMNGALLASSMGMLDQYYSLNGEELQRYIKSIGWRGSPEKLRKQLTKQVLAYSLTEEERMQIFNDHTDVTKEIILPSGKIIRGTIRYM